MYDRDITKMWKMERGAEYEKRGMKQRWEEYLTRKRERRDRERS